MICGRSKEKAADNIVANFQARNQPKILPVIFLTSQARIPIIITVSLFWEMTISGIKLVTPVF